MEERVKGRGNTKMRPPGFMLSTISSVLPGSAPYTKHFPLFSRRYTTEKDSRLITKRIPNQLNENSFTELSSYPPLNKLTLAYLFKHHIRSLSKFIVKHSRSDENVTYLLTLL